MSIWMRGFLVGLVLGVMTGGIFGFAFCAVLTEGAMADLRAEAERLGRLLEMARGAIL